MALYVHIAVNNRKPNIKNLHTNRINNAKKELTTAANVSRWAPAAPAQTN